MVFPIRGRNWCFARSIDPSAPAAQSPNIPSTFKDLFNKIFSSSAQNSSHHSKFELAVDFVSNKMNGAWNNLEKAPQGTVKKKIHGLGLKLLSRVKPSEMLFKSIPKEIDRLEIIYPSSLNPRVVRRRLRHIAFRGSVFHKKCFYGSAILLPLTSVFMVLPLPNVLFFWVLFRTYSHWRASQGSQKLLDLVSDGSCHAEMARSNNGSSHNSDKGGGINPTSPQWVVRPSKELQELLHYVDSEDGLSECAISKICKKFHLVSTDVKYRNMM